MTGKIDINYRHRAFMRRTRRHAQLFRAHHDSALPGGMRIVGGYLTQRAHRMAGGKLSGQDHRVAQKQRGLFINGLSVDVIRGTHRVKRPERITATWVAKDNASF